MLGVALVGLSGSMIKDTSQEVARIIYTMSVPEPTEEPRIATVLVGEYHVSKNPI
jgi:hypothetical protein